MSLGSFRIVRTIRQYLNAIRGLSQHSSRSRRRLRFRPRLESLEDLTLLSATLDVTGGSLTYTGSSGVTGGLNISTVPVNYSFQDTAETIILTSAAVIAGWTGSGTNTVMGPIASVTSNFTITLPSVSNSLNINGDISGLSGNVSLQSGKDLTLNAGSINTTGSVTLTASTGSISEAGAGTITGAFLRANSGTSVTLNNANAISKVAGTTAAGDFSFTADQSVTVIRLTSIDPTFGINANGNVTLTTTGVDSGITLPWRVQGNNVSLTATGSILADNSQPFFPANKITATNLALSASTGIGTAALPLQTQVSNLEADTSTGGNFITNGSTAAITLNIGGVDPNLGGVRVTGPSGSGPVVLTNFGTINILTDGDTVRAQDGVTVSAQGSTSDVVTGGQLTSGLAAIRVPSGGSGNLLVQAGQDILATGASSTGVNGSIGAETGSVTLSAGRDIKIDFSAVGNLSSTVATSGLVSLTSGRDLIVDDQGGVGDFSVATTGAGVSATAGRDITIDTGGFIGAPFSNHPILTAGVVVSAGRDLLLDHGSFLGDFSGTAVTATAGTATVGNITVQGSGSEVNTTGGAINLTTSAAGSFTLAAGSRVDSTLSGPDSNGGPITISADDMTIADSISASHKGLVTLQQAGVLTRNIDLGTDSSGNLGLTDAELDHVTADILRVGRSDNPGSLTVTNSITQTGSGYATLSLRAGGPVSETGLGSLTQTNLAVQGSGGVTLNASTNSVTNLSGNTNGFATFSTGDPDGLMATASCPLSGGASEIEAADDFILNSPTELTSATFTGLLPTGLPLSSVTQIVVEIYRIFPLDSTNPPDGRVPTRVNSPSDNAFAGRDSISGELTFSGWILASSFTASNSVLNGIHAIPNQTRGGDGTVTGEEVEFTTNFTSPISLPAGHYFFVPQVQLTSGNFFWLSAPRPIVPPGTPFMPDLQEWIRNANLDPDWLRVGTDIVGGSLAPTFNASFSLSGLVVSQPFQFTNSGSVTIGSVDGQFGITTNDGAISVSTMSGDLTVSDEIIAGSAAINVSAGGTDSKLSNTATINNSGVNPITLTADRMDLRATITNTSTGRVTLQPLSSGRLIDLGSTTDLAPSNLELSNDELNEIQTSGVLQVGNSSSRDINVSTTIFPASVLALSLETSGGVSQASGTHITVPQLGLRSNNAITLDQGNNIGQALAASIAISGQSFTFSQGFTTKLIIGSVDGLDGISTSGAIAAGTSASDLEVDKTINSALGPITLTAGGDESLFTNKALITNGGVGGGTIDLIANRMSLEGGTIAAFDGGVDLPATTGRLINLGPTSDPTGSLNLSNDELNTITAGVVRIGLPSFFAGSGDLKLTASISPTHFNTLTLQSGRTIAEIGNATLTISNLDLQFATGVSMGNTNHVAVLAGSFKGVIFASPKFLFTNAVGNLTIGPVDGDSNIHAPGSTVLLNAAGSILSGTAAGILDVDCAMTFLSPSGTLNLTGSTGIGSASNPLKINTINLSAGSSNAGIFLAGTGSATLTGTGLNAGTATITLTSGTFGLSADNQIAAASRLNVSGATLALGTFSDKIAGLTLSSSSTLSVLLKGFGTGQFGNLKVTGSVNLGNAVLSLALTPDYVPPLFGKGITLIQKVGSTPIVGHFAGLPNGSILVVGSHRFRILYTSFLVTLVALDGTQNGPGVRGRVF